MKKSNLPQIIYKLTAFALPISAGGLINMITSFISMMMVAYLGKEEIAAGALAVPTFMTIMTVAAMVFYAVGILISHQRGQGKIQSEAGLVFKNGFWLAILLAFPTALGLWYVDKLLLILGEDPSLVKIARVYFHFAAFSMIPAMINVVIAQFYAGIGKPHYTLWIALISLPLTLTLSYALILGHFGLPFLGLSGITCSYLIVQSILSIGIMILLFCQEKITDSPYQIFHRFFSIDCPIWKSIFSLGLPIGIQFGGELTAMTGAAYLMGHFGSTALAATQVVSQYSMIVVMIIMGITQALSLLTSEAYGKEDYDLVKEYLKASIILVLSFVSLVSILFIFFPHVLIKFYMSYQNIDPYFEHLTSEIFAISAVLFFADGIRHLLAGGLRGLHDSRAPMRIGIIAMWLISLPMSYFVGMICHGGPVGLRIGFTSGFLFAAILLSLRVRKKLYLKN